MVADHAGLAQRPRKAAWHAIFEVYDQPTPKSASRTDREGFTAQVKETCQGRGRPAERYFFAGQDDELVAGGYLDLGIFFAFFA